MDKKQVIEGVLVILLGVIILFVLFITFSGRDFTPHEEVDCYDRYRNIIEGQTCLDTYQSTGFIILLSSLAGMLLIIAGIIGLFLGIINQEASEE